MVTTQTLATADQPPALIDPAVDHSDNALQGRFGNDRSHGRRLIDAALDQQARTVDAALPIGADRAGQALLRRQLQIRILEHDDRRLAAQLQADRLERLRRIGQYLACCCARADKFDLVDAGMSDHRLADIGSAGYKIDDTFRETGLEHQFDQHHRAIGRKLGRF